jgi:hypothetical protein
MRVHDAEHQHVRVDHDSHTDFRLERTARISALRTESELRATPRLAASRRIRETARCALACRMARAVSLELILLYPEKDRDGFAIQRQNEILLPRQFPNEARPISQVACAPKLHK